MRWEEESEEGEEEDKNQHILVWMCYDGIAIPSECWSVQLYLQPLKEKLLVPECIYPEMWTKDWRDYHGYTIKVP